MKTGQATRVYLKRFLPIICCLLIGLTGCVRYDVGIDFDGQYRGAIVQHIELGKQLTSFSQTEVENWLDSIERRTQQLQGQTQRSPQAVTVTIPFNSGQELVTKFNDFFNPTQNYPATKDLDVLKLNSAMALQQGNWLVFQRNRLSLNADLRALGVLSEQGNLIVSPGSLIDLEFSLNTPWGARSVAVDTVTPVVRTEGNQLTWQLQPGQINLIEAVFWLPNPLGIGAVAIALLMVVGFWVKYRRFPWVREPIQSVS